MITFFCSNVDYQMMYLYGRLGAYLCKSVGDESMRNSLGKNLGQNKLLTGIY